MSYTSDMVTLHLHAKIDAEGRLTVEQPTGLPQGDVEIEVRVLSRTSAAGVTEEYIRPPMPTSKEERMRSIREIAGKLNLGKEAAEEIRRMRDEWER